MMTRFSNEELQKIIADRREWAKQAHEKDLHGTALEYELTANLAEELLRWHLTRGD